MLEKSLAWKIWVTVENVSQKLEYIISITMLFSMKKIVNSREITSIKEKEIIILLVGEIR